MYQRSSSPSWGVLMLIHFTNVLLSNEILKGTICEKDKGDRPCLIQLLTRFQVSDYHNFWNNEK